MKLRTLALRISRYATRNGTRTWHIPRLCARETDMNGDENCGNCRYYKPTGAFSRKVGRCRRYPPIPNKNNAAWLYPATAWNEWCGEWKAIAPVAAPKATTIELVTQSRV